MDSIWELVKLAGSAFVCGPPEAEKAEVKQTPAVHLQACSAGLLAVSSDGTASVVSEWGQADGVGQALGSAAFGMRLKNAMSNRWDLSCDGTR